MKAFLRTVLGLTVLTATLLTTRSQAATIVWLGTFDGNWATGGNWQGGSRPTNSDSVSFGDVTNQTITLGGNRTVVGADFDAADAYLISDTGDTLTMGGTVNFDGTGTTTFNTETAIAAVGALFTGTASSGMVTFNGLVGGSGSVIFDGGSYTLTNNSNTWDGGTTIRNGAVVTLAPPSNQNVDVGNNSDSLLGHSSTAVNIDGGTLRLVATGTGLIGTGTTERTFAFGQNGGLIDFVGKTNPSNNEIWTFQTNASAVATPIVRYGTPASATDGWAAGANALQVGDGKGNTANGLLGSGPIIFDLAKSGQGALLELKNSDQFTGTLTVRGVPGGNSAAPNNAFNVSRVGLFNDVTYAFNWAFENAAQVSNIPGSNTNRILDGNITLAAGADVAFGGRPDNAAGTLALGATSTTKTLTINSGAQANLDVGFRTDATTEAGVILNLKSVIEPGGTLRFRKTVASITAGTAMQLNGDITGKGDSTNDARFDVQIDPGTGNGQLNMAAATNFVVNGSGTGGLRVEGTGTRLTSLLTTTRLQQRVTGSGGVFTIAPSGSMTVSAAPTAANNPIKLGVASSGTGGTITLGVAANDLANWASLVVKPSSGTGNTTAVLGANQSLTSGAGVTTTLDVVGGTLDIGARNLTVEGQATLIGGTIAGTTGKITAGAHEVRSGNVSARLSGNASLVKTTSGQVVLSGVNDYLGTTTVQAGLLQILPGATAGAGNVSVAGGSILANSGTISGNVTASGLLQGDGLVEGSVTLNSGGVLNPGSGIGRLSIGSLSAPAGNYIQFDIAGTTPVSEHDQLRVTGGVSLGTALLLNVLPAYAYNFGQKITLIDNDGSDPISGVFMGLPQDAWVISGSNTFQISYTGDAASGIFAGAGNDVMLVAIPEPSIFGQLGFGIAMLIMVQRRRGRFRF